MSARKPAAPTSPDAAKKNVPWSPAAASPVSPESSRLRSAAASTPPSKPAAVTTSPRKAPGSLSPSTTAALGSSSGSPATGSPAGSRVDSSPQGSGISGSSSGSITKTRHVIVKQGEVWKLMDDEKTWKKRFLVISERSLYFYKSSLKESEPKPIKISLTRIDRVHDGQKRRNSLVIVTPNRSYEFYVVESGEFKEWTDLLREIAQQKKINREPSTDVSTLIVEELKDVYPAGTTRITADQLSQLPMQKLEQVEARLNRDMEAEISAQWNKFEQKRDQLLEALCQKEIKEMKAVYAEQIAEIEQELKKRKQVTSFKK